MLEAFGVNQGIGELEELLRSSEARFDVAAGTGAVQILNHAIASDQLPINHTYRAAAMWREIQHGELVRILEIVRMRLVEELALGARSEVASPPAEPSQSITPISVMGQQQPTRAEQPGRSVASPRNAW